VPRRRRRPGKRARSPGLWAAFMAAPTEGFRLARLALRAPAMDQLSFRPVVWRGRVLHELASKDKPMRPLTAFADSNTRPQGLFHTSPSYGVHKASRPLAYISLVWCRPCRTSRRPRVGSKENFVCFQ
jgi:hypothetical protein